MPANQIGLLGSGTSPNEALHAEINKWFANQAAIHSASLQAQLDVNLVGKLMIHGAALYHPTLTSSRAAAVLSEVVHSFVISSQDWTNFCLVQLSENERTLVQSSMYRESVQHTRRLVRAHNLKRPAAFKKPAGVQKRTPFTLRRARR